MKYREILRIFGINQIEKGSIVEFYRQPKPIFYLNFQSSPKAEDIFSVLFNPAIRRGDGIIYDSVKQDYVQKINYFMQRDEPIEFVFLGFPFKCHNPLETPRRTPDLGELAFILRLLDIDATVQQIYPPGIHFTVLKESNVYKDFFGAKEEELEKYENRLEDFITALGGIKKIVLVDLMAVCLCIPVFEKTRKEIEKSLNLGHGKEVEKQIQALIPVMKRSLPITSGIPIDDLVVVFEKTKTFLPTAFQERLKQYVMAESRRLALRYLAFQEAKRLLEVVQKSFPEKLYVSTISRPDRYRFHPIHRRTRYLPHHGVPVLESEKVDIVFFSEVIKNSGIYSAVFCQDDIEDAPFYFLKGKQFIKNKDVRMKGEK